MLFLLIFFRPENSGSPEIVLYFALLRIGCQNMRNSLTEFLTVSFSNITFKVIFSKLSDLDLINLHTLL